MYKIQGSDPGVHYNVGLSQTERTELDSMSLKALVATHMQAHASGSSNYRGVSWNKRRQKWEAQIRIAGKPKGLGYFHLEEDAASAYDREAKDGHGL
jgi:hypothetical protein